MDKRAPTYHLGPDFRSKLDRYLDHFLRDGFEFFAEEFRGLDEYVEAARQADSDETLRQVPKEKYLLELVSFALYDRLNRDAFNKTDDTLIVLPDCLSLHNPECEMVDRPDGDRCRKCVETCQAARVTQLASRYKARAVFAKRAQAEQLQIWAERLNNLGVIGIACVNMLAVGMRTAAEVGIPSRGVLLNFSGCEHWQDKPCASEFAFEWLESILEEKYGHRGQKAKRG